MESVLCPNANEAVLPAVVYLDDIAVYGDTVEEVLAATVETMRRLARAGFMLNLKKCHLIEQSAKILGHNWSSGGYWTPSTAKLEMLRQKPHKELAKANRASLYGLLNFYRDYVP